MSNSLQYLPPSAAAKVDLPGSKSIANRLLIIRALSNNVIELKNLSTAKDTVLLQQALSSNATEINVGMAGTAFRFLTAYYSTTSGTKILTGSERMLQRPIGILVNQLRELGADIEYLGEEGFPPLKITGKALEGRQLEIDASVSSQYISALLLISPYLKNGLELKLKGEIVSSPYIDLTIDLQRKAGIKVHRKNQLISVKPSEYFSQQPMIVEGDWSSAAFFYQMVALSGKSLFLNNVNPNSQQGDVACGQLFSHFGVDTLFKNEGALLSKNSQNITSELKLDLTETPDLIPSIAVVASQVCPKITILGTKTLYIKECNRVEALKLELAKIGVELTELDGNSFEIIALQPQIVEQPVSFLTYNDHRMAMALAPLACRFAISIDSLKVVEKSFPNYWEELKKAGIST